MVKINWEKNPLIPVVVQSVETKEVLMLAYMNEEAFKLTRATGYAHYYSRSRKRLWKKGESSNNTQKIVDTLLDCDGDTLLLLVEQRGVACHTGRKKLVFTSITKERVVVDKTVDVEHIYGSCQIDFTIQFWREKEVGQNSTPWTQNSLAG